MRKQQILLTFIIFLFSAHFLSAKTEIIAHRGASSVAPENTMAAFEKAVEIGSDYFELDVRSSFDDSLMIMHDATIDRTTNGSGNISSIFYASLRTYEAGSWFSPEFSDEKIPTLSEALDLALASPYEVGVVIEIKAVNATIVGKVVEEVQKRNMQNRVIISSFTFSQIEEAKTLDPTIPVQLFGTISQTQINQVSGIGGEWVGTGGTVTQALLDSTHLKNMFLNKWTVNSAGDMIALIDLGVDGITTNYPQTAIALLDSTPPTDVVLDNAGANITRVKLNWQAAQDDESGIVGYEIYRDTTADASVLLTTVGDTTIYIDQTLQEAKTFYYRLKAKNLAGLSSANFSNEISVTTGIDNQPPKAGAITAFGENDKVVIEFNERVESSSAENITNYQISEGVTITSATLALDSASVILKTSALSESVAYTVTISGIIDLANTPNLITEPLIIPFTYKNFLPQTIAALSFDEGLGETVNDASGNANHATLVNGLGWSGGQVANGLLFDGIDDYANIPSSTSLDINGNAVSVSVWVKLAYLPSELPGSFGPIYDSETDNYVIYEDKNNNELRFKVSTLSGAERPGIPAADLVKDEWFHILGVYDGSTANVYLNGVLKDSHALTGDVRTGQVANLGLSGTTYFKGGMDNVQVFNRALTEEEISFLYNDAKTKFIDDLAPEIATVTSVGTDTKVYVEFNEKVDLFTSETIANYTIDNGVEIFSAELALDERNVVLTTSAISVDLPYVLTVNNVTDQADEPNAIEANSQFSFTNKIFPPGLVSAWFLDEGTDTTAHDFTSNMNTITLKNGEPWAGGKFGNGFYFDAEDGIDDYATVPNTPSLDIDSNGISLSLWTKLDFIPSEMPFNVGPIYDASNDRYVLYEDKGNKELRFKVTTSGGAERPGIPEADLVIGEWLHIVGVYDGSSARIYMNGELKDVHEGLSGNVLTGQSAQIGHDGPWWFSGGVDHISIFDRGLSAQEVAFLYSGTSVPTLTIDKVEEMDVSLSWQHQVDPVKGISGYNVYRDTSANASTLIFTLADTANFVDFTAQEFTDFYYRIKSIDASGMESDYFSNEVKATTVADVTAPEIVNVTTTGESNKVLIEFTETVDILLAEDIANYSIDNGVTINSARLSSGKTNVILDATGMATDVNYTLTINNITDIAQSPNTIAANTQKSFNFYPFFKNLISYWTLDEGADTTAFDVSGFGNDATLFNNPTWIDGKHGNAIRFDGVDDYVEIPNSTELNIDTNAVTLTLWVKLDYLPTEMPTSVGPIYDAPLDRYVIYEDRGNKELRFKVSTTNGAERPGIPEASLKTDEWLLVTGVYNGSQAMIYLNGQLMDVHENLTGTVKPDQVARLGQDGSHYFNGEIDNVQIYNRALSEAEIMFLFDGKNHPTGIENESSEMPTKFTLKQNYPNPFNPSTTLSYTVAQKEKVSLIVYDILGRKVKELVNEKQIPGIYRVTWNGKNQTGASVSTGVYLYKITAGKFTSTKKMILVR